MAEDHSIKNLVSRTATDPWNAVIGRRPGSYQIPEVGQTLMNMIDAAVFERRLEEALLTGFVFEKWAEHEPHFACKAPAVMSTVFCIGNQIMIAEEKIEQARKKMGPDCKDCKAHYLKRRGTFLVYDGRLSESLQSYSQGLSLFGSLGNDLERAKCFIGRGVVKTIMNHCESGLADEEAALNILGSDSCHHFLIGSINRVAILTRMGRQREAQEGIEKTQELLAGLKNVERSKLTLRWIKALLLEETGGQNDRRIAGQMLDRVEARMRTRDMHREIRVLLADRARIARAPHTIKQIARKALAMETSRRVRTCIEAVIGHPTRDNILKWRNMLDSYVPPFTEIA